MTRFVQTVPVSEAMLIAILLLCRSMPVSSSEGHLYLRASARPYLYPCTGIKPKSVPLCRYQARTPERPGTPGTDNFSCTTPSFSFFPRFFSESVLQLHIGGTHGIYVGADGGQHVDGAFPCHLLCATNPLAHSHFSQAASRDMLLPLFDPLEPSWRHGWHARSDCN